MTKQIYLGIDFAEEKVKLFALRRFLWKIKPLGFWQVPREEAQSTLASLCQELAEERPPEVVVGLSRRQLIYRKFTLPPLRKNAICEAVGYQLVERSPYEPDKIKFAYRLKELAEGWQVEALAVPIEELETIRTFLSQAGIEEVAFAPSSQAMALLAKEGELVGRVGAQLELGLPGSFWGRDLPLSDLDAQLSQELERTVIYLEGTLGKKLELKLAGRNWEPKYGGEKLGPDQIVAFGLALAGVKRKTLKLHSVGEGEGSWLQNPYLVAALCFWLGLGVGAGYLSHALKTTEEQLQRKQEERLLGQQIQETGSLKQLQKELAQSLPQYPPKVSLDLLRQLGLAAGPAEGYLTLTFSEGEIKELSAKGPQATDFIRRLAIGPLAKLTLEGPIVDDEGAERFTLKGPLEAHYD